VKTTARLQHGDVLEAARQYKTPWIILATAPLLYVWVIMFWGGRTASTAVWFSLGVVAAAAIWSVQGWQPWNMAWIRIMRGSAIPRDRFTPIQQAAYEFFRTPGMMRLQFFWISLGSVIPWVIMGVSRAAGGQAFRAGSRVVPWWAMLILGVGEAVRGRAAALYALARALERKLPELQDANGEA
jgi:hypothetical protein